MKIKTTGIFNEGKNNTFINNVVTGFDVAMKDKGSRSCWKGNKLEEEQSVKRFQTWWGQ